MEHVRCTSALLAVLVLLVLAAPARAASSSFEVETIADLYHITADRTVLHSRERVKEAFGHVVVSAEGKRLACDYLWVDDNTKEIKARGNVVFVDKQTTVEAAELHFNMNTGFGSIFYGRVYNDLYSLRGQLIRRVGDGHYLTTEGEYTTCKDCPESWKLAARNVDLTVEGYAFMDGVFIKIKDIPTLYIPYLIVPVKRERQTGLLFPRIGGSSSHGFVYVQPLFLAIDKHQDATIAGGIYSDQGTRYEAQYRYKSYHGIEGQVDVFYSRDRKYAFNAQDRGAISSRNEFPFDKHFNARARFFGTVDRDYTFDFPEDINFQGYPAIESNVVAQAPFDDFFIAAEARRYQSLVAVDPARFDHGVVQATPTVHAGVAERHLVGPLYGNLYGRFDNFVRHAGSFTDLNGNHVFDPVFGTSSTNPERIREAKRTILQPEVSAPFSVGRFFGIVPSLQYNQINYKFGLPPPSLPNGQDTTSLNYLHAQVQVSTTIERVYEVDSEKTSRIEHQISPFVTASYIPKVNLDDKHPFEQQVGLTGGPFDQFDVVPFTNATDFERFPQGKSIYYGFDSRLIRKNKRPDEMPRPYPYDLLPPAKAKTYATPFNRKEEKVIEAEKLWDKFNPRYDLYQEFWTLNVAQAFDFLESRDNPNDPKRAFSYALAKSSLNLNDQFSNTFEYRYYPFAAIRNPDGTQQTFHDTQTFNTAFTWYWKRLPNLRKTHFFQRSISAGASLNGQPNPGQSMNSTLTWSFNDFFTVQGAEEWDIRAHVLNRWAMNAVLTHPSECWGLAFHWDWNRTRSPNMGDIGFQVLLNLDGSGFMGKGAGSTGTASFFGGT